MSDTPRTTHHAPPIYHLDRIQHSYGSRRVLDVTGLAIQQGEIFGLVGPSGAGKSTLLRLLNFLELPGAGTLTFAGQPVTASLPLIEKRRVVAVFQKPGLLNRTVAANIAYGLKWKVMHYASFNFAPEEGKIDPQIKAGSYALWKTDLDAMKVEATQKKKEPAPAMVLTSAPYSDKYVFSMIDSAASHCIRPGNGAGMYDIYSICSMRIFQIDSIPI